MAMLVLGSTRIAGAARCMLGSTMDQPASGQRLLNQSDAVCGHRRFRQVQRTKSAQGLDVIEAQVGNARARQIQVLEVRQLPQTAQVEVDRRRSGEIDAYDRS